MIFMSNIFIKPLVVACSLAMFVGCQPKDNTDTHKPPAQVNLSQERPAAIQQMVLELLRMRQPLKQLPLRWSIFLLPK